MASTQGDNKVRLEGLKFQIQKLTQARNLKDVSSKINEDTIFGIKEFGTLELNSKIYNRIVFRNLFGWKEKKQEEGLKNVVDNENLKLKNQVVGEGKSKNVYNIISESGNSSSAKMVVKIIDIFEKNGTRINKTFEEDLFYEGKKLKEIRDSVPKEKKKYFPDVYEIGILESTTKKYSGTKEKYDKKLYMIQEKAGDMELFDFIEAEYKTMGYPTKAEMLKINTEYNSKFIKMINFFKELLNAVKSLHDLKYIHCDLKPENIMITVDKNKTITSVKLIDFDFLTIDGTDVEELFGSRIYINYDFVKSIGLLKYNADEEFEITKDIDIYSLGIIFYAFFTSINKFIYDKRIILDIFHINMETSLRVRTDALKGHFYELLKDCEKNISPTDKKLIKIIMRMQITSIYKPFDDSCSPYDKYTDIGDILTDLEEILTDLGNPETQVQSSSGGSRLIKNKKNKNTRKTLKNKKNKNKKNKKTKKNKKNKKNKKTKKNKKK